MRDMTICLICPIRNERVILPFLFRHYDADVDHYIFYDGLSDDGTRALIAAHPKAEMRDNDTHGMTDDKRNAEIKSVAYRLIPGYAWYLIVDADEFIYSPRGIRAELAECDRAGATLAAAEGWDMIGDRVPDGGMLTDAIRCGVRNVEPYHLRYYDKVVAIRDGVRVSFQPGAHGFIAHGCAGIEARIEDAPRFKLLHYKYLSREYVADKAAHCRAAPENHKHRWGYVVYNGQLMQNKDTWLDYYDRARAVRERVIP